VKSRGKEIDKKKNPGHKRFRKILVGDEKLNITYLSLLHLAAAIITYSKAGFIYG